MPSSLNVSARPQADVSAPRRTESPLDDAIARQYGRWVYPEPIADLSFSGDICDPVRCHHLYWPDREYPPALDILVAGCGANQAAHVAYNNRSARVLGIDVSEASLAHERHLRDKHKLDNLELVRLPIEDVPTLGRDFDLILSTGVLHHMAEPLVGMTTLGKRLRRDGAMAVFLYGRHGRVGLEILQSLFRRIGLKQDEASLAVVRKTLDSLPAEHPLRTVLHTLIDMKFDSGLVDLFLNARERSYTVEDCLKFVADAGLVFQGWLENADYHPEGCLGADHPLFSALSRLPTPDIWAATDHYVCNRSHYFVACRSDRPPASYRIDFAGEHVLHYVPVRRLDVRVLQADRATGVPARLARRGIETHISDAQARLLNEVDGRRSIAHILAAARAKGLPGAAEAAERFARDYFRSLWRMGLIFVKLPAA